MITPTPSCSPRRTARQSLQQQQRPNELFRQPVSSLPNTHTDLCVGAPVRTPLAEGRFAGAVSVTHCGQPGPCPPFTALRSSASGCRPGPSVQASHSCSTGRKMALHVPPHSLGSACRQCSHGRRCCHDKQSVRESLPITSNDRLLVYLLTAVSDDARHKLPAGIVLVVLEADGALAKRACTCRQHGRCCSQQSVRSQLLCRQHE